MQPTTPNRPRTNLTLTSPHAMSARARIGGGVAPAAAPSSRSSPRGGDQGVTQRSISPMSLPALNRLRVAFPDARETNIVRRNLEIVMSELADVDTTQASDQAKVRLQVSQLNALSKALEQTMSVPVTLLSQMEGLTRNQSVVVGQREANRVAVEDDWMRLMSPAFGHDGSVVAVTPRQEVVRDEPGEKKIRLLSEMLTQSSAEVTRLREELAMSDAKLARKDDRIIELEATVHTTTLSMTAMELAMTKLKRKAAVGGGGGGGAGLRIHAAALTGTGPGASQSASSPLLTSNGSAASTAKPGEVLNTSSTAPASTVLTGDMKTDRIALSRRSIAADRKRCLIENPGVLQVESLGQDFGPRGRIGIAVVRVPHFKGLMERYPDVANQTLDTLRDAVRGMLEVCDGFEFRQMNDVFACAFDDCTSAVEFGLSLTSHLHNSATWAKEVSLMEAFKTVTNENGSTIFNGLRASIGIHTGFWSGPVDLLTQRKMYSGELLDKAVIASKSCPAGLLFITNDVIAATGMREYLGEKLAAVTAIPPWGVHIVLPNMLRDRVAVAAATPDAPLSKSDWVTLLAKDVAPLPAVQKTVVCCQVEGFLNALIDGEIPVRDLYHATTTLRQHIDNQMFWSHQRRLESPPVVVRQEGEDKLIVLFDSPLDAFDFATSLQEDAMQLPWPTSVLEAGIGVPEKYDLPDTHRLKLSSAAMETVTLFRGLRLQIGIHICKGANSKTNDWFNGIPRWDIPEVNVAIGLSHASRGGEILASISVREAVVEEQRRMKADRRLSQVLMYRMGRRVTVPELPEPFDVYHVATHSTAYRFRDVIPEQSLDAVCRLAQYGAFEAPTGAACGILGVAISHGTFLNSTDGAGFKEACDGLQRVFSICMRRFNGVPAVFCEEHASLSHAQLPILFIVFPDVRAAAAASLVLHQESLKVPLSEVLRGTPYSQAKLNTNNGPLYSGLRLKVGLHVGRAAIARAPPQVARAVIAGDDVRKTAVLCHKAQAGLTLCSPLAAIRIMPDVARLSSPAPCLHELLDFPIDGFSTRRNPQLLLPMSLKERITSVVPDGVDTINGQISVAIKLYDKLHRPPPPVPHTADGPAPPAVSPTSASRFAHTTSSSSNTKPPIYDPEACVVSSAPQMFVVCRIPNVTSYLERSQQFGKDMIRLYLSCARELLAPLRGKELDCEGEALLLCFEFPVNAVQWAQQFQVSLTCAKWPVEIMSSDFCKEVRSTTRNGGAGRTGALFRGPRALVAMEWGIPKRCFDDAKLVWRFFGDPIQYAIELSHWGHGGMIVLSKRAKAVVVQELTQESTRQMLESPNIVALGNRAVRNSTPAVSLMERSAILSNSMLLSGSTMSELPPQLNAAPPPIETVVEPLFSLIPLVFFERTYPPFPDAVSEERRFSALASSMLSYEAPHPTMSVHCMMVHIPSVRHAAAPLSTLTMDPTTLINASESSGAILRPKLLSRTVSPTAPPSGSITRATSPALSDTGEDIVPMQPSVTSITEEHLLAIHPFLFYFGGKIVRATKLGAVLHFPRLIHALAFTLAVSSNTTAPQWASECAFSLDDDSESIEPLATLITPFCVPSAVTLSEELFMSLTQQQCATVLRGHVVGWPRVLDATPLDELEAPPLRLLGICALRATFTMNTNDEDEEGGRRGSISHHLTKAAITTTPPSEEGNMKLLDLPREFWKKPVPTQPVARRTKSKKSKEATSAAGGTTSDGAQATATEATSGDEGEGGDGLEEVADDVTASFEKDSRDESFLAAMATLDPGGDSESARVLKELWENNRQQGVEDERRVRLLEAKVASLTETLESHESNQKLSSEVILRAHRTMRQYRSKLDGFFKKAMIEEVVYGNDADIFVTDWLASMKAIANTGSGATTGEGATGGGGARRTKASLVLSPREEFSSMIRQAIEDDGGESRANPTRLYASLVGHLARVFSGIERLLKQRDRMSRLGGGMHRAKSVRFPSAGSPPSATGGAPQPSGADGGRRMSLADAARALSPADDRKKSLKQRLKSVLLLSNSVKKSDDAPSA